MPTVASARADPEADLLAGNLDGFEAGSVLADVGGRCVDHFEHLAKDVATTFESLAEGRLKKFAADALDLDVHLQGSDADAGTSDLEVHVAVVVLGTLDVGEDGGLVAFPHKTHRESMAG